MMMFRLGARSATNQAQAILRGDPPHRCGVPQQPLEPTQSAAVPIVRSTSSLKKQILSGIEQIDRVKHDSFFLSAEFKTMQREVFE